MYILCEILICATLITVSLAYSQGSSGSITSRYLKHKNYNLLPPRGKCGIQDLQDRILGGNVTASDEFPWMTILEYKKNGTSTGFQCGGSLINPKYIVTAAHCLVGKVKEIYGDLFNVRFGENDLDKDLECIIYPEGDEVCSDPPVNIGIEEMIPHPSYDDSSRDKYNDIALVRLKTPVNYSMYIKPICLPLNDEKSVTGEILTVSGWGKTESGNKSRIKLKADLPLVSNKDCAVAYLADVAITDTQLCAGAQESIDSCNGDSGSPLMRTFPSKTDFYIEGIVSFGILKCGTKYVPGVYTRVNKYIDWILDNMKP